MPHDGDQDVVIKTRGQILTTSPGFRDASVPENTFVSDVPMARNRASTDVDRLLKLLPHLLSMPSDLDRGGGLSSSSSFGIGRLIRNWQTSPAWTKASRISDARVL